MALAHEFAVIGKNTFGVETVVASTPDPRRASQLFALVKLDTVAYFCKCGFFVFPTGHFDPLAFFQRLVLFEEVLDLFQR